MTTAAMTELPDDVRDAAQALGLAEVLSGTPLRGGRSGRTWRVVASSGTYVLHRRSTERGVDLARLRREQRCTALAHGVGVGPQPVAHNDELGLLLTRWIPGRACPTAKLADPETLAGIALALRTLHTAPLPRHRVRPTQDRLGYLQALARRAGSTPSPFAEVLATTADELTALGATLDLTTPHVALVHGDVVPGNIIVSSRSTSLVDFEYAGQGDPAFDLGNLAASASLDASAVAALARAYSVGGSAGRSTAVRPSAVRSSAASRKHWELRANAWKRVAQGGWIVWVALGDDLGAHTAVWRRWARHAADDLAAAHASGELRALDRRLSGT